MRTLAPREKLILRIAAIGVPLYLILFVVMSPGKNSSGGRGEYQRLSREAEALKQELKPYELSVPEVKALMEEFQMDPAKLSKATVVAQASSAIQKTAASGGLQLGPIRESPGRSSAKELATIKIEGSGQLPSVLAFLKRLETLGYPLLIESVQLNPESRGPGMIKMTLTIIVLDFEQWKSEGVPHA